MRGEGDREVTAGRDQSQGSKCIKSPGNNSLEAFSAYYGSDFLNYINCSLEASCNCFTLRYCEKCRF